MLSSGEEHVWTSAAPAPALACGTLSPLWTAYLFLLVCHGQLRAVVASSVPGIAAVGQRAGWLGPRLLGTSVSSSPYPHPSSCLCRQVYPAP